MRSTLGLWVLLYTILNHVFALPQQLICNGDSGLCDRRWDNVTVIGSHDSFAFTMNPFQLARDQEINITAQLYLGVRLLQAQAHLNNGVLHFCHTSCALFDGGPVLDYLKIVKAWLDKNPNEVLTFIFTNPERLSLPSAWAPLFKQSGISKYAYIPPKLPVPFGSWPTLRDMVTTNKRLVIFLDYGASSSSPPDGGNVSYILPEFDMIWETPFSQTDLTIPCRVDRISGSLPTDQHIYMINHSLNKNLFNLGIYVSDPEDAPKTNSVASIINHANNCSHLGGGRFPTFVLIDFVNLGNAFAAARLMNGIA